jgi:hypothetical protein
LEGPCLEIIALMGIEEIDSTEKWCAEMVPGLRGGKDLST